MKYFTEEEFQCKCGRPECDAVPFDASMAARLELLRQALGEAIIITSGSRCQFQNDAVGGEPLSQHLNGCAVDILCSDGTFMRRLLLCAIAGGFNGIGIKKHMIHLDARPGVPVAWGY